MIYVVFCYFVILFFIARAKQFKIASYLIGVYTFSIFFSIILYNSQSNLEYQYANLVSSIVFCVLLLFYFIPFFKKNIIIEPNSNTVFLRRFILVGRCLSIILIIGCIFLVTKIKEALAFGLVDTRIAMYKDESVFTSYNVIEHIGHSLLKWLGGLCYTVLIMFFYAYSFIKKERTLKVLLLISSLSAIYLGLLVGGRTNLMYWVLTFIFCLVLFWSHLSKRKKKLITIVSLVTLGLLASYLIFISIGRAAVAHGGETENFLITYAGQSYLNFCYFFENLDFHQYTSYRIFPLTSSLLFGSFDLNEYRDLILYKTGMNIGIFYTFLGDIFVDTGLGGMLLYSIVYFLIARRFMGKKLFTLSDLLILGVLYQIPLHGLFYYSFWKTESSVSIILIILISKYLQTNKMIRWKM
ncbi:O-antigen polymerase [Sphingobacterium sp. 18053]|uniref:O-antigen polymerase n=1 Tax=Sphingobacterium sp. 18053 TaxID=2681401 RepID=UPI00135C8FC2|nr:O-antigen polymerase [Sphingobacterium sp. 18053]